VSRTALLVMDVQPAVVARYPDPGYLGRLRGAVETAREAGVPVIFVGIGFRAGAPEVDPGNRMFGGLAGRGLPATGTEFHPGVAPRDDEPVVTKRRVSAFAGSDLDMLLRAQRIDHLVLTGIATSGVVLSTVRQAADLDYRLTVLADGCLDNDPEVHAILTERVFPAQAEVTTIAGWPGR
jgi:nicotinamidase-related amidase